jgi:hypothetical protein
MPSVGKNELLAWLGAESGQPCRSLEDLKNGTIILATLDRIFPRLAERRYRVKRHPRFDWEHGLNWESIAQMCQTLKLPTELIDRSGLQVSARHRSRSHNLRMTLHCAAPQACRFKPIYHLLVTLYFFRHVSIDRDFVADFAHPIDGTLAAFLQARRNQLTRPKPLSQPSPKPQPRPKPKPSPARLLRALSGSPSTRRSPVAPSRAWWPVARSLAPRRRSSRPPRRAGQSRHPARLVHRSSRLVAPLLARRRAVARTSWAAPMRVR